MKPPGRAFLQLIDAPKTTRTKNPPFEWPEPVLRYGRAKHSRPGRTPRRVAGHNSQLHPTWIQDRTSSSAFIMPCMHETPTASCLPIDETVGSPVRARCDHMSPKPVRVSHSQRGSDESVLRLWRLFAGEWRFSSVVNSPLSLDQERGARHMRGTMRFRQLCFARPGRLQCTVLAQKPGMIRREVTDP